MRVLPSDPISRVAEYYFSTKPGLSDQFVTHLFKQIHQESNNFQNKVMN